MEIRTHLLAGRLADLEALLADDERLDGCIERTLRAVGMEPEDVPAERVAYREAIRSGAFYTGLSDREKRRLDRIVARILEQEVGARLLLTAHAYRFEWLLGFLERRPGLAALSEAWYPLAHGRRLAGPRGGRPGLPEHVPYYAWLTAGELRSIPARLDEVVAAMEEERGSAGLLRRFERRGTANDAAFLLAQDVRRVLGSLDGGDDLFAVTRV